MYVASNVMNMVIQWWTVCIKYNTLVCLHIITGQNPIPGTTPDRLLITITRTDTDTADQGLNSIPTDITVTVAMIHTEDVPGHIIETIDITTGVLHDIIIPVIIIPAMTPLIADCLHIGAHPHTLGIGADHVPIQHTEQVITLCINL